MTIPQPQDQGAGNHLDFVVMVPPNHNTDGKDCVCGHAETDHEPTKQPESSEPVWQCLHCSCTRPYPARVSTTN